METDYHQPEIDGVFKWTPRLVLLVALLREKKFAWCLEAETPKERKWSKKEQKSLDLTSFKIICFKVLLLKLSFPQTDLEVGVMGG
jgi:hypothetical protein